MYLFPSGRLELLLFIARLPKKREGRAYLKHNSFFLSSWAMLFFLA
jgi:hypothetical protein